jgi:hypothetical protein
MAVNHLFPPKHIATSFPAERRMEPTDAIILFYKATGTSLSFSKKAIEMNYPDLRPTVRELGLMIRDYYTERGETK